MIFNFQNFKTSMKLAAGFGVVLALLVTVLIIGLKGYDDINQKVETADDANRLIKFALALRQEEKSFIIEEDFKHIESMDRLMAQVFSQADQSKLKFKEAADVEKMNQIKRNAEKYQKGYQNYIRIFKNKILKTRRELNDKAALFITLTEKQKKQQEAELNRFINLGYGSAKIRDEQEEAFEAAEILTLGLQAREIEKNFIATHDEKLLPEIKKQMEKIFKKIETASSHLEEAAQKKEYQKINQAAVDYREAAIENILAVEELDAKIENMETAAGNFTKLCEELRTEQKNEMLEVQKSSKNFIIAVSVLAIIAGLVIAFWISKIITDALNKGVRFAQAMAGGDLRQRIDLDTKDETGLLAKALNDMADKLTEIIESVSSGSQQVAAASEQLAKGNQDLSNRTEQQASALEETSSAIEEMNSSIKSNADSAKSADQLSKEAAGKSKDGTDAVGHVVTSMNEINDSSKKIAEIIKVMNDIAFQTNLLALNASIEAARAGEQGRGFAVVAVEVRKLAQRSDEAAKEIADLIESSNQKVERGVGLANDAGSVLGEINNAVKKVTDLISEISAASQEQLSSAEQINDTLSNLDENTQQNASLVEEAASSTEELSGQAQELSSTIEFFKIHDNAKQNSGQGNPRKQIGHFHKNFQKEDSPSLKFHQTESDKNSQQNKNHSEDHLKKISGEFKEF